jgi:transaldolase/glucose-6-phosphate isomerase
MNPLRQLERCGQSPWLDYLNSSLISSGELRTLIDRDGLKGITSNPSIFEAAIGEGDDYGPALRQFQAAADHDVQAIYEHLVIGDIRAAADALGPIHQQTKGRDGYVSLECSPYLANDTIATLAEARRLWAAVERDNLMVKVPATPAGIPAIRHLIGGGINVNVTLLFSALTYEQVAEAYIAGLEDLVQSGGVIAMIGSVASIFVSRIDAAIDKRLDQLADPSHRDIFRDRVAVANAKLAYARYKALFSGPRWQRLADAGAQTQRLLWASTSPKSPALKDTFYVEALIGRDTVDTIPPATMDAFRDHGEVRCDAIEQDVAEAHKLMVALEEQGISLEEVTARLVEDGVRKFSDSFDTLLGAIARSRRLSIENGCVGQSIGFGSTAMTSAVEAETELWRTDRRGARIWAGDPSLWSGADEGKWIGWLHIVEQELVDIGRLQAFAAAVQSGAFTDLVLLGMGGSSLGAEVFADIFSGRTGGPRFHLLDSTDPEQILALAQSIELRRTLFIISSKSGDTLEPNLFLDYFFDAASRDGGADKAAAQFVAVTDPASPLETRAKQLGFSHIFYGRPAIGGRYSVLSNFGLVPAASLGIDVERVLKATRSMQRSCGPDVPPAENPAIQLGVALGVAATRFGRDKVTIVTSPGLADFGAWLEQLLAESTGKQGRGLIPLAGEPLAAPDYYGNDRFFAYLELNGQADPRQQDAVAALEQAGHPVARIHVPDIWHLGQEFFRWEFATAVAGAIIGIDPFDQPDVEASKDETRALTKRYEETHALPAEEPMFRENGITLFADPRNAHELGRHNSLSGYLASHFRRVQLGDYAALSAYLPRNDANTESLTAMRTRIRDNTRAATCLGYGPRFQHSTGQVYQGGPNSGVFLQITCDDPSDIDVPGHSYSFGVVKAAQARGDLAVLVGRGRRALRVHLKDVEPGLAALGLALDAALSPLQSARN